MTEQSNQEPSTHAEDASISHSDTASAETAAETSTEQRLNEASSRLNFSKLDLSVEAIDERISPDETNVFDK